MKRFFIVMLVSPFLFAGCDIFLKRAELDVLKQKENRVYALRKDIDIDGKKLRKGEDVRIVINSGGDWVKVHAYPARADELKADRILILYLFSDDFKGKKFDPAYFYERLNEVIGERGEAAPPRKAGK
jgi:type II secretion system-associated lipoprotein